MPKYKVGDIVSVRVKIAGITEDENNKFSFKVKRLDSSYDSMNVLEEDITAITLNVPLEEKS
jgi:hypothetical protein